MAPEDSRAIGRLEGRVESLEGRAARIEDKLDALLERQDADRQSVVELRVEELTRQIDAAQKMRASLRPKPERAPKLDRTWLTVVLPWVLVGIGALAQAAAVLLGG